MASGVSVMQRCTVAARWLMSGASTATPSASASAGVTAAPILCGRGDKKTKKGKRFKGSYGKSRPKKEKMIERIKDKVEVPSLWTTEATNKGKRVCEFDQKWVINIAQSTVRAAWWKYVHFPRAIV